MTANYPPIEHHGIIGNRNPAALVGIDGCIDFLCFPYFDSPSVFASLLDWRRGGRFKIAPGAHHSEPIQSYEQLPRLGTSSA